MAKWPNSLSQKTSQIAKWPNSLGQKTSQIAKWPNSLGQKTSQIAQCPKSPNTQKKSSQTQQSQRTLLPSAAHHIASKIMEASPSASNSTPTHKLIFGTSLSQQLLTSQQDHRQRLSTSTSQVSSPPTSLHLQGDPRTQETKPSPPSKRRVKVRTQTLPSSPRSRASRTPS
jgi:hypothetical protein